MCVAAGPDPLWEIVNSFQGLFQGGDAVSFGLWRQLVRPCLGGPGDRLLAGLLPGRGYFPDFLTPAPSGGRELASGLDTVLGTSTAVLRRDLALLAASPHRRRPLPDRARSLADGESEALRRLGSALHGYHGRAIAPFWPQICAQVDADRAARARAVLAGGADGLLASFAPVLRWRWPVLEADYPVDREVRLQGRGVVLQPSFFCTRTPITLAFPAADWTPVLVYPVEHTPHWVSSGSRQGTELGALLGRTRAAILEDVVTGRTTGELAARFGISGAAASQHTAVLRRAGLLLSVRRSRYVLHTITQVGIALLEARPRPSV
ncbi:ArsR/SmtB family transcription factor [Streptomyces griseorubiginosus]|uniref:ArsR/SmtB family transcription factor n=1 Tax=Streptomyces griseorubiginosus TaxID=67304 RepID=UPI00200D0626|nr:helix-turn-helix domain-containing protein [Streptomyces griseorubiginosus]